MLSARLRSKARRSKAAACRRLSGVGAIIPPSLMGDQSATRRTTSTTPRVCRSRCRQVSSDRNPAPHSFVLTLIKSENKIVRSGTAFAVLRIWKEIAMKASSLFVAGLAVAAMSMAPANAAPVNATGSCAGGCASSFRSGNAPWVGCSGSGWPALSPTCRNVANWKTYAACMEDGLKVGWKSSENGWYCSSLGLK